MKLAGILGSIVACRYGLPDWKAGGIVCALTVLLVTMNRKNRKKEKSFRF